MYIGLLMIHDEGLMHKNEINQRKQVEYAYKNSPKLTLY